MRAQDTEEQKQQEAKPKEEQKTETPEKPKGPIEQGYFSYPDVAAAEQALQERNKILRLEKQVDYRRPQLVYALYCKVLGDRMLKTAEGYAYLLRLREYLEKYKESLPGKIPALPADLLQDDTELKEVKARLTENRDLIRRMRTDLNHSRAGRSIARVVIAFLVIAVIAMLVIAEASDNPNILNYERVLQDRYAVWEMELNERERTIREKERSLGLEAAETQESAGSMEGTE
ncbi:MAG: hypothetical protein IJ600_12270 [Lachnospiraceae bacterium]|nr:hypothetical protein [Lachnospiraceae bacterium]